jgi:uncharacterized protein (DUF1919 family)
MSMSEHWQLSAEETFSNHHTTKGTLRQTEDSNLEVNMDTKDNIVETNIKTMHKIPVWNRKPTLLKPNLKNAQ